MPSVTVSSIADGQQQLAALAAPTSLPIGSFLGRMVFFNGAALVRVAVNGLWKGIDFDAGRARITFSGPLSLVFKKDEGAVTMATSIYDGKPCVRIDFDTGSIPRFYETRGLGDGRYFSIVTHKLAGGAVGAVSDFNVLYANEAKGT